MPILVNATPASGESAEQTSTRAHATMEKLGQLVNLLEDDASLVEAGVIRKLETDGSFNAESVEPFIGHFRRAMAEVLSTAPASYGPMVASELYTPDASKADPAVELNF